MTNVYKPCLILDLDETVIYSVSKSEKTDFNKEEKQKLKVIDKHKMEGGYYTVTQRPGLQKFLDFVFSNFKVSIWTAASKDYALDIIDNVILNGQPGRKLDWIWFDYHCDVSDDEKGSIKDLSLIWDDYKIKGYTKSNTLIMDDHPDVYSTQPSNCIRMYPFAISNDDYLTDDVLPRLTVLLEELKLDVESGKKMDIKKINDELFLT
jgi:TFIIF-interacting CTD phosphatase-like protein